MEIHSYYNYYVCGGPRTAELAFDGGEGAEERARLDELQQGDSALVVHIEQLEQSCTQATSFLHFYVRVNKYEQKNK
jgi:hypothetical protein